jgi:uncharacterized protein (DUF362 family)
MDTVRSNQVFCVNSPPRGYGVCEAVRTPEMPDDVAHTSSLAAIRNLFHQAGLDSRNFGSHDWNPLGDIIHEGDSVLIKPNWVHHINQAGAGLDCLVTHTDVIEAILRYALKARPRQIIIGDAPIQDCDLNSLLDATGVPEMVSRVNTEGASVTVRDFRLVRLPSGRIEGRKEATDRSMDDYVLFDLGPESRIEPITSGNNGFRVTKYDPAELEKTHARGTHRYLVAREAIEADVVINVPKLKTHKKSCMTGALKCMVGINGHKSYLPHHRKGGSGSGGDCYAGASHLKALSENLLDAINRSPSAAARYCLGRIALGARAAGKLLGVDGNLEGSWYGNDTIWRTCLDLQTILHYGVPDGLLNETPQRTVLTITDAIVAGEGEGPMSVTPVDLGMLTMGLSVAAVDWVNALLMGFDPSRIPLTREAFSANKYPLADFGPKEIRVCVDGREVSLGDIPGSSCRRFSPPKGWQGHCELEDRYFREGETTEPTGCEVMVG